MKTHIEWHVIERATGQLLEILTTPAQLQARQGALRESEVIRPLTDAFDKLPPANASCTVSEWLAYEIRTEVSNHAAAWARKDHAESGRASKALLEYVDQLTRLASAGEGATGAQPNASLPRGEAELTAALAESTTALARCRDAFPAPAEGSDLEVSWMRAMGDPDSVPDYLEAIAASQKVLIQDQLSAVEEKAAFDACFNPEYLAHRQAQGVGNLSEFAFAVWKHARRQALAASFHRRLLNCDWGSISAPQSFLALVGEGLSALPIQVLRALGGLLDAQGEYKAAGLLRMLRDDEPVSFGCPGSQTDPVVPPVGSVWTHRNGNRYTVFAILNKDSERQDEYPTTVAYIGDNGRTWSRPLNRWHASMTLVDSASA